MLGTKVYPGVFRRLQKRDLAIGGDQPASAAALFRVCPAVDAGRVPVGQSSRCGEATANLNNGSGRFKHEGNIAIIAMFGKP